jgi:hypothetical protein
VQCRAKRAEHGLELGVTVRRVLGQDLRGERRRGRVGGGRCQTSELLGVRPPLGVTPPRAPVLFLLIAAPPAPRILALLLPICVRQTQCPLRPPARVPPLLRIAEEVEVKSRLDGAQPDKEDGSQPRHPHEAMTLPQGVHVMTHRRREEGLPRAAVRVAAERQ